jgi:hypothetical protein
MYKYPNWMPDLKKEDRLAIIKECNKAAEKAWNSKMDSYEKVYLANKELEKTGQMSVFDYV